ncbi:hypothetical protein FRC06_010451 [Ceratobasidium sp. 370]|nr:hypothetical protein FRC06_010451 [Ceratobasidium sp. 370]
MPPRPKRTRLHPARTTTRSQAQAAQAPSKPAPVGPSGAGPRRTRSNMILEVVLPTSKKPTPKTSSAPTPDSLPPVESPPPQEQEETDQDILRPTPPFAHSPLARVSTPRAVPARDKGKQKMDSLPPSSPPPDSSPRLGSAWDRSSRGSTPTPSPSRSRQVSRQGHLVDLPDVAVGEASGTVLVPGTPSSQPAAAQLPTPNSSPPPVSTSALKPPISPTRFSPEAQPESTHKPPTSPAPYSDTATPADPFGFLAAEDRLRERRAVLERDDLVTGFGMPSSGGPEDFDQSVYEEAFASIFYDPQSGMIAATQTSTTGSDKENAGVGPGPSRGNGKGKVKQKMEVEERERGKEKERARESSGTAKGKGKAKEHVLTTYELEAMLPRRPKRSRKPRVEDPEEISLSEGDDDDDDSGPKRRRKATVSREKATRGKAASRGARGTRGKKDKEVKAAASKSTAIAATRSSKRTRSIDTTHMDDESRQRFEMERDRRLKQYQALDGYTLEEEEVVW